jgi:hypothetical protein
VARSILIWPAEGRKEVQEQSQQDFVVSFTSARALSAPTTARYRLKNLETGAIAKDWTVISTPSSQETISIAGDLNTIRGGLSKERYELTVQSDYDDTGARQSQSYVFKVVNISGVVN